MFTCTLASTDLETSPLTKQIRCRRGAPLNAVDKR